MKSLKIVIALLMCWAAKPQALVAQIWKPVGQGFEQVPVAVTSTPDYMYFAFVDSTSFGGNAKAFLVARWNGFFWQNLSTFIAGQGSQLTTMAWYKNKLYVGGFFDTVLLASSRTGLLVLEDKKWKNIAQRRVDDFSPLRINDLEVFENQLYAAGAFSRIDTTRANGLAVFDGISWEAVNNFQGKYVGIASSLETYNDTLFVSGNYTLLTAPSPIIKIKGATVLPDTLSPFESVRHLQAGKNELMVFGEAAAIKTIQSYKNGGWHNREKNFPNLQTAVFADATFYNNEFWACGSVDIGGKTNTIIKWADTGWVVLDDINLNGVRFIKAFRNKLFAAGNFVNYRRIQLNHIAEYDENLAIITGKVYVDINNNCKQDVGERPVVGQVVRLWNGIVVAYTDRDGVYSFVVPKSGSYQINTLLRKYWSLSSCTPSQYLYSPSVSNPIFDSADFPIRLDLSIQDVSVKIVPNTGFKVRRGYTEVYNLIYRNNGGQTIPTGKIRLKIDDSLDNFIAIPPPSSVSNGIAEWNYTNLAAGEVKGILFRGKVNSSNTNSIAFTAEAQSTNDAFADDNYDTLQQTVSKDSTLSGKYIFPEPVTGDSITIFPEKGQHEVEYLIRFENKTADTVNTVVVVDTIDLNLSLEYIQELGASHPYTTQVINLAPQYGKGILVWTFSNIKLPPNPTNSNDFTDNRGHVRFKMRLSATTPIGTLVVNKAHILYDYDVPNATNSVFCMLDKTNSIAKHETLEGLSLYPNPTNNTLNIQLPNEALYTLAITDIQGKECLSKQHFTGNTTTIDVTGLPQGIYILQLSNGQQSIYAKFVKQ